MKKFNIFSKNFKFSLSSEWLSVFLIIGMLVILSVNLIRAISDANKNYQVYLAEKESLSLMQQENLKLQNELQYYQSYEYKKLYARDNLRLGEPGETLYKIVGDQTTYNVPEKQLDLFNDNNLQWWMLLVN